MPPTELRQAAQLLQKGRKDEARALLIPFVRQHPNSEYGWLLLSLAVTDRQQQIECLRRTLTINPENARARDRLTALTAPEAAAEPETSPEPMQAAPVRLEQPIAESEPEPPPAQAGPAAEVTIEPQIDEPAQVELEPEAAHLEPLRDEALREQVQPRPQRRVGRWILGGLAAALLSVLLLGGGLFIFNTLLGPPLTQADIQATARAEVAAAATSQAVSQGLPPTWTPTLTPTSSHTPTPTTPPTATSTPTLPAPNPTVGAEMEVIQQQVADLRGLNIQEGVVNYLLSKVQVRRLLEESFLNNGGSRAEVEDQARALSALGLIKPSYDLFTNTLNGLADSVGGFYFPWSDETFVIGTRFSGIERWVYSHEYAHALVDQHFDINSYGVYPVCTRTDDECTAIQALVEGDATLLMTQWYLQYAEPSDRRQILNYNPPPSTLPEQDPPPYSGPDALFPYDQGLEFVLFLYERGNWAEVNRIYARLPQSTEQILHPQKYLAGEAPRPITLPDLAPLLGDGWRLLVEDRLGEWKTFLLLGYGADFAAQLDDPTAETAAAGWGGDAFRVYFNDGNGQVVLASEWRWDTVADAGQFRQALREHLDARFRGGELESANGECWQANDQITCMYARGDGVLWLLAPDLTTLQGVLDLFPSFP